MTGINSTVADASLAIPEFRAGELSGIQVAKAAAKLPRPGFRLSGYRPWPE